MKEPITLFLGAVLITQGVYTLTHDKLASVSLGAGIVILFVAIIQAMQRLEKK
ncbi:MAG TPA: hypothetical protein VJH55_03225 [Candidatus Paceibacterota bacterium]